MCGRKLSERIRIELNRVLAADAGGFFGRASDQIIHGEGSIHGSPHFRNGQAGIRDKAQGIFFQILVKGITMRITRG